jgi:carbonic anhydrase
MPNDSTEMSPRDRLVAGLKKFQNEVYPKNREAYERAASTPQAPHTLIITCADSRIDPELITQSGPGEIFVTRNIGNLVPTYGETVGGVSAVIEYAVLALNVRAVMICGHTDCGAMKGLLHLDKLAKMPIVRKWLRNAEAALSVAEALHEGAGEEEILERLIEHNVVLQMSHLRTHPSVAGRTAMGTLAIYGCVYEIGTGHVRFYDEASKGFAQVDA